MSDVGELVGFAVEAAGEVVTLIADASDDRKRRRPGRRAAAITLLMIVASAIGVIVWVLW
jgi:hypothetical protein